MGAGPPGLLLGQLLHPDGIGSIILENRSRDYVIERVRASVLEHGTVDTLVDAGVGGRLVREGMRHGGIQICFRARRHRIDFEELTGGRGITVYGQNEIVLDLLAASDATGRPLFFEVQHTAISDYDAAPRIAFQSGGEEYEITCDSFAGCDGSHGICRPSIAGHVQICERVYPPRCDFAKKRFGHAQTDGGTDAARPSAAGRRRGTYCAAHWCQGVYVTSSRAAMITLAENYVMLARRLNHRLNEGLNWHEPPTDCSDYRGCRGGCRQSDPSGFCTETPP